MRGDGPQPSCCVWNSSTAESLKQNPVSWPWRDAGGVLQAASASARRFVGTLTKAAGSRFLMDEDDLGPSARSNAWWCEL